MEKSEAIYNSLPKKAQKIDKPTNKKENFPTLSNSLSHKKVSSRFDPNEEDDIKESDKIEAIMSPKEFVDLRKIEEEKGAEVVITEKSDKLKLPSINLNSRKSNMMSGKTWLSLRI